MTHSLGHGEDAINVVLSREEEILPSSGFAASVMSAVQREAAAPPPIPFPWKRALPGLVVAVLTLALLLVAAIVGIVQLARMPGSGPLSAPLPSVLTSTLELQRNAGSAVTWSALALLVAFVSVKFSTYMVSDRT